MSNVKKNKASRVTAVFVTCSSFLAIFIFLYCGLFAVPSADDYAYANLVVDHDFWRAQLDSYIGWSGRYTATLLITWFGKFYLQQYWLVPWLTLFLLFFSFYLLDGLFSCEKRAIFLLVSYKFFCHFSM